MKDSQHLFVLASLPAALVGVWNLGNRTRQVSFESAGVWQLETIENLGISLSGGGGHLASFGLGLAFFLPLLLTALATSRIWAHVFASLRNRPLDPGWFLAAWLYALLLPATMPLHFAALGLSFGVVIGCHLFGGTGRYIVNPALLGVVFTALAYPHLVAETRWLPGSETLSTWAFVAANGVETSASAGITWASAFLGSEIGAIGAPSGLACLLGGAFLALRGLISVRIMVAGIAALLLTSTLVGDIPSYLHVSLGSFTFLLAFCATDPTTQPRTSFGCWAFGAAFGALTVVVRMASPDHPEAAASALLLASLCVPLLDYIGTQRAARAGQRGLTPDG